ncbi:MAG: O-antigen ligase family protein [Patescibacteria group bacterium]|jgi:O-antigen ligase
MNKIWNILWRLAVLSLPWQTRWFADASLTGWPWEQGRVSLYISWIPLVLTMIIGALLFRRGTKRPLPIRPLIALAGLFIVTIIATQLDSSALRAVLQWWVQIGLLIGFAWTMRRSSVSWMSFAAWFVIALIPHAALGFIQYATQHVEGSTLLGIAPHFPETPGTSVVEHGMYRVLRIYGGFPHPNIFGGWLALGVVTSLLLAAKSEVKTRALFPILAAPILSVALLFTYSRSAWVAIVAGVLVLFVHLARSKRVNQFFILACAASLLAIVIVGFPQRDHLLARSNMASRLESQSVSARVESLRSGWTVFRSHVLFGTGPNAELHALAETISSEKTERPLEPAHNVFLLALAELGVIGMLLLLTTIVLARVTVRPFSTVSFTLIFLVPLFVIGMLDHYPWSLWAGESLVAMGFLLGTKQDPSP